MTSTLLILAGIGNSGPEHWQSHWQRQYPDVAKLEHTDWDSPDRHVWVQELDEKVARLDRDVVLVAHSLACLVVAHWAASSARTIGGALLVSVPDPRGPSFPSNARHFEDVPMIRLPFPSVVVSSTDDPYATSGHMRACAAAWGSQFRSIGPAGHINAASNIGAWKQGQEFLSELEVLVKNLQDP